MVTPAAAAFKLPWGRALPGGIWLSTAKTQGCVSAVALRVAEALAALTLERDIAGHVRLYRDSSAAEFREGSHLLLLWASTHRHNKMWSRRSIACGVLIAAPRAELHYAMDTLNHRTTKVLTKPRKSTSLVLFSHSCI